VSQQDRTPLQGSPVTVHAPAGYAQCFVVASQIPSQQSAPVAQTSPPARQYA
jgi:hypothetical protein